MDPLFEADGDTFTPTGHTRGPWDPGAMHGGAPAALIARAVERVQQPAPMRCVRLTIELLRPVPIAPIAVTSAVLRPGRRLQVVEASLSSSGAECCRARAVLLRVGDVDVPAPAAERAPAPPEESEPIQFSSDGDMFPTTGMELRFASGTFQDPGPAMTWFRPRRPLVAGEEWTPLQRVAAAADFGNGISSVLPWDTHVFVNPDLSIHLHREPAGEWVGVHARTDVDAGGIGLSSSVLRDTQGRIGVAAQSLFVDRVAKP